MQKITHIEPVKLILTISVVAVICFNSTRTNAEGTDIEFAGVAQTDFSNIVEDFGAAVRYKPTNQAKPLGLLGLDIGFDVSEASIEHRDSLNSFAGQETPETIYIPKLYLHKVLPQGFGVGAFYSSIPSSNMSIIGGEVSYAIMKGSSIAPAIAVRGSYSQMSGVDNFNLNSTGLELSISKGFAMFTPYAGVGTTRYEGDTSESGINDERINETKYFLGLNFDLGLVTFAAETEQTGDNSTTTRAKIGVRF